MAFLKLPAPLSLRFDTNSTSPPRPPVVYLPKPSAPGKAMGLVLFFSAEDVMMWDAQLVRKSATKKIRILFISGINEERDVPFEKNLKPSTISVN